MIPMTSFHLAPSGIPCVPFCVGGSPASCGAYVRAILTTGEFNLVTHLTQAVFTKVKTLDKNTLYAVIDPESIHVLETESIKLQG